MSHMTIHALEGPPVLSEGQTAAMVAVAAELDRLNAAIRRVVDAGLSVELHRSKRYHCGGGCWGDMMRPVIVKCRSSDRRIPQVSSSA